MSTEMQQNEGAVVAELEALVAEGGVPLSQSALDALAERVAEKVAERLAVKQSASAPSAKGGKTSGRKKKAAEEGGEPKQKKEQGPYFRFMNEVVAPVWVAAGLKKGVQTGFPQFASYLWGLCPEVEAEGGKKVKDASRWTAEAIEAERVGWKKPEQSKQALAGKNKSGSSTGSAAKDEPEEDAEEGEAEKPKKAARKCSACKQTGHTKAKCAASGAAEAKPAAKKAEPKAAEPVEEAEEAEEEAEEAEEFGDVAEAPPKAPEPAPTPKTAEPKQSVAEKLKAKKAAKSAPAVNPHRLKLQTIEGIDLLVNALGQAWLEEDGSYTWAGLVKGDEVVETEEPADIDPALFEVEM